jgi:Na+-driven multidrug efflux pump
METTIQETTTTKHVHPFESSPIGKLILKFSVPCIMSLFIASLYNMVDQIFIGQGIGYLGNGATTVVYPLTVIALAVALLVGDGCAAYLSLCHGRGDKRSASKSVANSIIIIVAIGVLITVLSAIFSDGILYLFAATEDNFALAKEYLNVILIGLPFYMFGTAVNSIIRADGSPRFALISNVCGCIINVILDPIAIFVLKWGMTGAAIATIVGQIVTAALTFAYLFKMKSVKMSKADFIPDMKVSGKVLTSGLSSFLTQVSIVLTLAVMNNITKTYGAMSEYGSDIPQTIMGIVMKMFAVAVSFIVGTAAGCQPIVGYNYGAGNYKRVKEIYKRMVIIEVIIGVVATLCFELLPLQIISLFGNESNELYNEFAVIAFRIYLSGMILCCIQKSSAIFLQSIGKPILAMLLSLVRDFILLTALIIILPIFMGVTGALYAAPIADIVSFILTVVLVIVAFRSSLTPKKASGASLSQPEPSAQE